MGQECLRGGTLVLYAAAHLGGHLVHVALGVACFSAMSSAIYVLNDWCDREVDRKHPVKRLRPLAAGTVAQGTALALGLCLALASSAVALIWLSHGFAVVLAIYVCKTSPITSG